MTCSISILSDTCPLLEDAENLSIHVSLTKWTPFVFVGFSPELP